MVFAVPGTSSSRTWPPETSAETTSAISSCLPMTTRSTFASRRRAVSCAASAAAEASGRLAWIMQRKRTRGKHGFPRATLAARNRPHDTSGMRLDIRYARSAGAAIAYQVVGEGSDDLVYVPDFVSNLVYGWESPHWRGFYERLAESFRLILFDKRGTGLSDVGGHFPALETRMEDLRAVLDVAGSATAVLFGSHDGCSLATLYAATYPERTRALVLFHPVAHGTDADQPAVRDELAQLRSNWGTQSWCDELFATVCPSLASSDDERVWFANWLRVGASPAVAYGLNRAWFETDLRDVLPAVRVPTLVLYRTSFAEPEALDVAARIPGTLTTRVSGPDYWGVFLSPEIPGEIESFASGRTAPAVPETVLATLLFTDI